jgi:hypothetical protein
MRPSLACASAFLAALLATSPAPAVPVVCTYNGTIIACSDMSYLGKAVTGYIEYESTCPGAGGRHVYDAPVHRAACSALLHAFKYQIPATAHSGVYVTGGAYEIDMNDTIGVSSFNLHCVAPDGGKAMNCVVTLTYGNNVSPPGAGALPTCLKEADFRSLTLAVSQVGGGFSFTANLAITGCTSAGKACDRRGNDARSPAYAASHGVPSVPRMPASPGDRVAAHPGLMRRRVGSGC